MRKLGVVILIVFGVLLVIGGAAGTYFYLAIYRPIASPLLAISGARTLEQQRLKNQADFLPPGSGEVTGAQAAGFSAVESAVVTHLGNRAVTLEQKRVTLEQASAANALTLKATLAAFADLKPVLLSAKLVQIDAMNRANFSKEEFEWVRQQLYAAAGVTFAQLDVSDLISGVPDSAAVVRPFAPGGRTVDRNLELAKPLAAHLQAWTSLAFFGL